MRIHPKLSRRQVLGLLGLGGAAALGATLMPRRGRGAAPDGKPRFLIVLGATGGASIIDSFLPIRESEAGAEAPTLNCFPDAEVQQVAGTAIRCVDRHIQGPVGPLNVDLVTRQSDFLAKHKQELMVCTYTGTSVNHAVAQKRAITGNEAWGGRTLQEAVAAEYGAAFPIPNLNMGTSGFLEDGKDESLPPWARAERVASPHLFPFSLDPQQGLPGAPPPELVALARRARDERLDPGSAFHQAFHKSPRLGRWLALRQDAQQKLQGQGLMSRLNIVRSSAAVPLADYGIGTAAEIDALEAAFPNMGVLQPTMESQAALAFLLIKHRISVAVTIAPSFAAVASPYSPPLAFDTSHQNHRNGQAFMWNQVLRVADALIDLLAAEPFETGGSESLWDRTLIYIASDFGRTKRRPPGETNFGTGHELNNGCVVLSPLANGNRVLGGVSPTTGLTHGFEPESAAPAPLPQTTMTEAQIYAGLLHALGVSTSGSGLPDMRSMRRS